MFVFLKYVKNKNVINPPSLQNFFFLLANNIIEMLNIRSLVGFNEQP
jgi:hypothetical protein